jgi:predicted aminopeptidase
MRLRHATRAALAVLGLSLSSCSPGYVLRSAWYEAELLRSRVPLAKARSSGRLEPAQLEALDHVDEVKVFGRRLGLKATRNYESVALGWNRRVWNVTACEELAFRSKTWWFPIVGRVPYRGYFDRRQADRMAERLARQGWDVNVREASAYSTLGWFRDPILPPMLSWDEFDLAETILHELAHATLWVKGSVAFNESFAAFVGEQGAFRYFEEKYGADSPEYRKAREDQEDYETWRQVQHALFGDLQQTYADPGLDAGAKRERKKALFASLPERVAAAPLHDRERYQRAVARRSWNNAHLAEFRTYHSETEAFAALLARSNGDLIAFIERVRALAAQGDPFAALERAAAS